jgi:hypothetical protein
MKTSFKKIPLAFVVVFIAATANAACGDFDKPATLHQQSWNLGTFQSGSLLTISERDQDPIAGMWHVTFTAQGNEPGLPDGTPIDNSMVTWHSDGTEIMQSDRPPQDGQICMGIWVKIGKGKYKLNHMPWLANDTTNGPSGIGNPTGPVQLIEEITLSPDGRRYAGTFTLDAYDLSGNQIAHIRGVLSAKRLTINTNVKDLL